MRLSPKEFWFEYTFADYQRRAYFHIKDQEQAHKNQWEVSRFNALANNLIKHNKNGKFNKDLTFMWEVERENHKRKKDKSTTQEEMSRISAYWNKIFQNQLNANGRN